MALPLILALLEDPLRWKWELFGPLLWTESVGAHAIPFWTVLEGDCEPSRMVSELLMVGACRRSKECYHQGAGSLHKTTLKKVDSSPDETTASNEGIWKLLPS